MRYVLLSATFSLILLKSPPPPTGYQLPLDTVPETDSESEGHRRERASAPNPVDQFVLSHRGLPSPCTIREILARMIHNQESLEQFIHDIAKYSSTAYPGICEESQSKLVDALKCLYSRLDLYRAYQTSLINNIKGIIEYIMWPLIFDCNNMLQVDNLCEILQGDLGPIFVQAYWDDDLWKLIWTCFFSNPDKNMKFSAGTIYQHLIPALPSKPGLYFKIFSLVPVQDLKEFFDKVSRATSESEEESHKSMEARQVFKTLDGFIRDNWDKLKDFMPINGITVDGTEMAQNMTYQNFVYLLSIMNTSDDDSDDVLHFPGKTLEAWQLHEVGIDLGRLHPDLEVEGQCR